MRYPTENRSRPDPPSAPGSAVAFRRPRLPHGLLWRPRLAEMLEAGMPGTVTLVCAGAGWGKTSLVASWAERRPAAGPTAWLTLGPQHDDPYAFWPDVERVLGAAGAPLAGALLPDAGATAVAAGPAFLERLAWAMSAVPATTVLVLDDLQAVRDPRVLMQVGALLRERPDRLRVILIAREEPAIPLHRLRAAGHLTEIRSADLAFCTGETTELLTILGHELPDQQVAMLVRRTEGWAAGLRLMIDSPDEATGRDAVEEYLLEEVLGALPVRVRAFLMRTSVPDRVSPELAEALTGLRHPAVTLDWLLQSNLFLERAADGPWFRYHQMFRAVLRRQLETTQPETLAGLHAICARWYAREGLTPAALAHAAAARDWDFLATLVVDHGLSMAGSIERAELFRILRTIPVEHLAHNAELSVCAAILLYSYGDFDAIPQRIAAARARLEEDRRDGRLDLALTMLEIDTVIRRRGSMPQLIEAAGEMLARLSHIPLDEVPALVQYRAMALLNKGVGLLWIGRLDQAESFLWAAATTAGIGGPVLAQISAFGHLGLLALLRGALGQADEHVVAALDLAERTDAYEATSAAYLTRSLIESEQGRDVEADEELRRALYALGEVPDAAQRTVAGLVRVRLLIDYGDLAAGRGLLRALKEETGPDLDAPMLVRMMAMAESEVDLVAGEPEAVVTRYGRQPAPSPLLPPEQILLAQALLAVHEQRRGEELLERVCEGPDRVAAVTAWVRTALMADAQGRTARADEAMSRALALAEPERIRRPFRRVDARRLLALAERWQWFTDVRRPAGENALAEISGELPVVLPSSSDRLSEREMDVMRYLPTVLTAAEIAENLSISVNTVKAHMRAIYRKLGAARRREAIAIARQLGYL